MFEGINRIKHKRTEELAREVLHDLKCLEHCQFQCAWLGASESAHRDTHIPGIILKFDYPQAWRQPALAIAFITKGFANGSPAHDAKIKYVIREKVEDYLKKIGLEPGINTPADMRLDEHYYA